MGSLTAILGIMGGLACVQACDGTRAAYFTDVSYHEHNDTIEPTYHLEVNIQCRFNERFAYTKIDPVSHATRSLTVGRPTIGVHIS